MKELSKKETFAIIQEKLRGHYWERAFRATQNGFSIPKPRTKEEEECASDKCQHFSCSVTREIIKLSQIDTRDYKISLT
jgi:hypothetical protein